MKTKQMTIDYSPIYELTTTLEQTELFCPLCGNKDVWVETTSHDYYMGSEYYCLKCDSKHNLDSSNKLDIKYNKAILEALLKIKDWFF